MYAVKFASDDDAGRAQRFVFGSVGISFGLPLSLADIIYIVDEDTLRYLDENSISYEKVELLRFDDLAKTLALMKYVFEGGESSEA